MWITEANDSKTSKHGGAGPSSRASLVHAGQGEKDILLSDTELSSLVQLIGKDVEHELGVTVGVDMAMGLVVQKRSKLRRIDQVSVMCKGDAVRAVHIEWLCLSRCAAPGGWVAKVTESHESWKILNTLSILEDLGGHTVALALVDTSSAGTGCNTAGILSAVLEIVQGVVEVSRGIGGLAVLLEVAHDQGKNSTHGCGCKELRRKKVFNVCQLELNRFEFKEKI